MNKDKPSIEWIEENADIIEILPDGTIKESERPQRPSLPKTKGEYLGDAY